VTAVWDILLSPTGLALYAGFWLFKSVAGAWVLRRTLMLLPHGAQIWAADKLTRLKSFGRGPRRAG
jgi:hypothetical protein